MKFFSLLLLCYLAVIAQVGLASEMIVAGSRPNLPLVVLCLALFWLRDAQVFFWAILVGIICETFDDAHPGTGVLVVTGLCWFVYRIQVQFELRSLVSRASVFTTMALAFDVLFQIVNQGSLPAVETLTSLLPVSAGNALYSSAVGLSVLLLCKIGKALLPVSGGSSLSGTRAYTSRYSH
ncbi:hypothetical protein F1728_11505 [Gimesia benthica]|uniref:Uncharacterized protein n=1 Tax=Gimesia benthica TaxID=2608982 RepID=A0A6I6AED9_9PLAN|nr:hypothetical protein [Gimesia benthica]QGQ23259.1 hypothetical protein F1728_11505 [Gimesia benthica]